MSDLFEFTKPKWKVLQDKKVFGTPIFSLYEIEIIPDKIESTHPFYVLDAPEWINVIALTPEKEIVLVEQYRAGIDEPTLEIPGGMVDEGEPPLEAARRELREETGYLSDDWIFLGKTSANPAILNNFTHIFLAGKCKNSGIMQQDGNEDILVHKMPMENFLKLVHDGVVHHSIVLAAVAMYLLKQDEIEY